MRKMGVLLVAAAAMAVVGCTSTVDAESTPTPTVEESANAEACVEFAEATSLMAPAFDSGGNANDAWDEVRVAFDSAGLSAEGAVQDRIAALVSEWPSAADVLVYVENREAMNKAIEDIARACAADGASIDATVHTFVVD